MKYKNIIKLRLPEIQLLAVVPMQLNFSIVKDHEPTILLFETLFCMWECFNMGTELPTKVMLGQTLVLIQMIFLNNVRKVGRLVLSRTSCCACLLTAADCQCISHCMLATYQLSDCSDRIPQLLAEPSCIHILGVVEHLQNSNQHSACNHTVSTHPT
jgi:hypothetical protein